MSTTQLPLDLDGFKHWLNDRRMHDVSFVFHDIVAHYQAALASVEGEPAKWDGTEGWEPLAWALCAEERGEDACNELIWDGGPIPEPWGDRWMKYEGAAKRMIALVREHVRPQPAEANTEPDQRGVTHITWDERGRRLVDGQLGGEHQADAAPLHICRQAVKRLNEALAENARLKADAAQGGKELSCLVDAAKQVIANYKAACAEKYDECAWAEFAGVDPLESALSAYLAAFPEPTAVSQGQAQQPAGDGDVARAWDEGYRAGINDERTSEANIGIAGMGMKVDPARENPYHTAPPASQEQAQQPAQAEAGIPDAVEYYGGVIEERADAQAEAGTVGDAITAAQMVECLRATEREYGDYPGTQRWVEVLRRNLNAALANNQGDK